MDFKYCKQKDVEAVSAISELKAFHDIWADKNRHIIQAVSYGEPPIVSAHFGDIRLINLIVSHRLLNLSFEPTAWDELNWE